MADLNPSMWVRELVIGLDGDIGDESGIGVVKWWWGTCGAREIGKMVKIRVAIAMPTSTKRRRCSRSR